MGADHVVALLVGLAIPAVLLVAAAVVAIREGTGE